MLLGWGPGRLGPRGPGFEPGVQNVKSKLQIFYFFQVFENNPGPPNPPLPLLATTRSLELKLSTLKDENIVQSTNYTLKTMTDEIINNKELKCESSLEKHTQFQQKLSEGKVNARARHCASYMKSLYNVIYPEGINPRKK